MPLLELICMFCWTVRQPAPALAHDAWDLRYRHEVLPSGRHLLRLSASDRIIDGSDWRRQRMIAFAEDFAANTCNGRYEIARRDGLTTYAAQIVFRCL